MSSNVLYDNIQSNNSSVGPYGNSSGSFATLDVAYNHSLPMSDFTNKMMKRNPLTRDQSCDHDDIISSQSVDKINNNIDEMVGAIYNRDVDIAKQTSPSKQQSYPHSPVMKNGVTMPLNRSQTYPSHLGSELLENFDLNQITQEFNNRTDKVHCATGRNILKFILVVIIILALLYAGYCLFKKNSDTDVSMFNITSVSRPSTITETLNSYSKYLY